MNFDLNIAIFIGFLLATIILGITSSRGVTTIKEFAIGDRNFSTPTIAATIIATWVTGEYFFTTISETYNNGLHIIWVGTLGDFLCLFFIGAFFAPRMAEFLGKLSIAEAMGDLFGQRVRMISAIAGSIGAAGLIAIQLKLAGLIFQYAIGMPAIYGILSAASIVTLYSALGGIKSVTFTDVIQFITFGVVLPCVAYVLLTSIENIEIIGNTLTNNPIFDYKQVFDFSNPLSLQHLFMFLWFIIPAFPPAIFQRISMAKNTAQVTKSFLIAAFTCLLLIIIVSWIGILTLSISPSVGATEAIKQVIFNSSIIGLKGIVLSGIMAMIMSTVDSYINATSVLVVHDFFKPLKVKFIKNELAAARIASLLIGIFALILSLREGSLLELLTVTYSLYMPIVTIPFILAILGFRSSEKSVLLSMCAGLGTVLIWDYVLQVKAVNSIPLGMLANLIVLLSSHYLLKQKGGWVGIKDSTPLIEMREERKLAFDNFRNKLKNFSLIKILNQNSTKAEGFISIMGLFVMISAFASVHTMSHELQKQYSYILDILYPITLCASSALMSYPLWLQSWKDSNLTAIIWNIVIFSVLIYFSSLTLLISNFSTLQLIVFMVNILLICSLTKWKWALFNIVVGVSIVTFCYKNYIAIDLMSDSFLSYEFKIVYLLILISSSLVIFLKPKQDLQELTEEKIDHLEHVIIDQETELEKALSLKSEFIRNITHEFHGPMTCITSMVDGLIECYDNDKLIDKNLRSGLNVILNSARRLDSYYESIINLGKLTASAKDLKMSEVNLSKLIYDRLNLCRKLYIEDQAARAFILDLEEQLIANCDEHYMGQTFDNLIINAINYCREGRINIRLKKTEEGIEFTIEDEGIGTPKEEIYDILDPFANSKTGILAGGRAVGLALCKKIIDLHGGSIKTESNGKKGSILTFILPIPAN